MTSHLILKVILWLSSYLDHTYTDSDDSDIQEIGVKPQFCFYIATLEKITSTNDTTILLNFIRRLIWEDSLYFALCQET